MSKRTIIDFGKNLDWTGNAFMAGILNNATGALGGGSLGQQAQQNAFGDLLAAVSKIEYENAQSQLISASADQLRQQAYSDPWSPSVPYPAPPTPAAAKPSVETIEHKPRVIELESEVE